MKLKSLQIACDFETGKNEDDSQVWVYLAGTSIVQQKPDNELRIKDKLNKLEHVMDTSKTCSVIVDRQIDSWFNTIILVCHQNQCGADIWFHNLQYDGDYILCYLKSKDIEVHDVIYGPQLIYFTCEVTYGTRKYSLTFRDTYQLMHRSLETIGKALKFEKSFSEYKSYPENCYSIPNSEIQYMVRDVSILVRMVATINMYGIDGLTAASYGLNEIKRSFAKGEALDNYEATLNLANNLMKECVENDDSDSELYVKEYVKLLEMANKVALGEKRQIGGDRFILTDEDSGSFVFNQYFQPMQYNDDQYLREAYKGGFCELNNIHAGKDIINIDEQIGPKTRAYFKEVGFTDEEIDNAVEASLDVNSMYLKILRDYWMPCGDPEYFADDIPDGFKAGVIHVKWRGYQVWKYGPISEDLQYNDIIMSSSQSDTDIYDLYLTYPEFYVLMLDQELGQILNPPEGMEWLDKFKGAYKTLEYYIIDGYMFDTCKGLFDRFVDKWYKIKSGKDPMMKIVAKQVLVNAVGGMGKRPTVITKTPVYENGCIKTTRKTEVHEQAYVALPAYVNSIGRCLITLAANLMGDKFIYSDTDSIKVILGGELPFFDDDLPFKLSQTELGCFKVERICRKARFLKLKTYIEVSDRDGSKVTAAGIPGASNKFSWDGQDGKTKFSVGAKYVTFVPKHVIGGIVLIEQERSISCAESLAQWQAL